MAKATAQDLSQRTSDMARTLTWRNGEKEWSPFSEPEMRSRQERVRRHMAEHQIDACLFTSYHNISYYSGFLYCYFGRKYGSGARPRRRHRDRRRDRWRAALAASRCRHAHLHGLAPGQLLLRRAAANQNRAPARHRVRPCQPRPSTPARGGAAGRRVRRHRPAGDVDADDQVGRGDRPHQAKARGSATSAAQAVVRRHRGGRPRVRGRARLAPTRWSARSPRPSPSSS